MVALARNVTDPRWPVAPEARGGYAVTIAAALDALPFARLPEAQLVDALRAYALAFARLGPPPAASRARTLARLDRLYPHRGRLANRELAQLLVYLEAPRVVPRTLALLDAAKTQEDQVHFAFVLRNVKGGWTLGEKRRYFAWLQKAAATYKGGASWANFLEGIKQDALARFVGPEDQAALRDVLAALPPPPMAAAQEARGFVHHWQMEDLEGALADAGRGRSFERGRAAYEAAQCGKCHRFGGEGSGVGPDLSAVGGRFSPRELLEAILLPSNIISDQYQNAQIVTKSGEVHVGAVVEETTTEIAIRPSPLAPDVVRLRKDEIASRGLSDVSIMPEGLVSILKKEEVLDLLAYLRSGGRASDPAFAARK
jgi:putative heme-binding domain-containing protein